MAMPGTSAATRSPSGQPSGEDTSGSSPRTIRETAQPMPLAASIPSDGEMPAPPYSNESSSSGARATAAYRVTTGFTTLSTSSAAAPASTTGTSGSVR